jgi:hypothetical protein
VDRTEVADGRGGAEGYLVQVLLAEQDGACRLQPSYDFCVRRGNAVFEYGAGQCGSYSCRIDVVFESDRDAVERPAPPAAPHLGFGFTRLRHRLLGRNGDECVEGGVQLLDPQQARTRQLDGRDRFSTDQPTGFANAQLGKVSTLFRAQDGLLRGYELSGDVGGHEYDATAADTSFDKGSS